MGSHVTMPSPWSQPAPQNTVCQNPCKSTGIGPWNSINVENQRDWVLHDVSTLQRAASGDVFRDLEGCGKPKRRPVSADVIRMRTERPRSPSPVSHPQRRSHSRLATEGAKVSLKPVIVSGHWLPGTCGGLGSATNPQVQLQAGRRTLLHVNLEAADVSGLELSMILNTHWGIRQPVLAHVAAEARDTGNGLGVRKAELEYELPPGVIATLVLGCSTAHSCDETPRFELHLWSNSPLARGPSTFIPHRVRTADTTSTKSDKLVSAYPSLSDVSTLDVEATEVSLRAGSLAFRRAFRSRLNTKFASVFQELPVDSQSQCKSLRTVTHV